MSSSEPVPEPPSTLSAEERAIWDHLAPKLWRQGRLPRQYTPGLALFIRTALCYLEAQRMAVSARAGVAVRGEGRRVDVAELEREAAAWRTDVRQMASDWQLLPSERAGLALVDDQGEDVELKRLLGIITT